METRPLSLFAGKQWEYFTVSLFMFLLICDQPLQIDGQIACLLLSVAQEIKPRKVRPFRGSAVFQKPHTGAFGEQRLDGAHVLVFGFGHGFHSLYKIARFI